MLIVPRRRVGVTDPNWANVALLLQPVAGGSIVDLSSSPKSITVNGDTQISTALGDPTLLFDGNADQLIVSNSNSFDTNQTFTFEIFFQRTSGDAWFFGRDGGVASWQSTNGIQFAVFILSGTLYVQAWSGSNNNPTSLSTTAPSTGAIHYVSVSYNGTTLEAHLNTSRFGSVDATLQVPTTRNNIRVGSFRPLATTYDFNGHIRALRWTTGVRRNTGATITVPSLPFPTQ